MKTNKRKVQEFSLVKLNSDETNDYGIILKQLDDINGDNAGYVALRIFSERRSANMFTRINTFTGGIYFVIDGQDDMILLEDGDFVEIQDMFTIDSVIYIRQLIKDKFHLYDIEDDGNLYKLIEGISSTLPKYVKKYSQLVSKVSSVFGSLDAFDTYCTTHSYINPEEDLELRLEDAEDLEDEKDNKRNSNTDMESYTDTQESSWVTIGEFANKLKIDSSLVKNALQNEPGYRLDERFDYSDLFRLPPDIEDKMNKYFTTLINKIDGMTTDRQFDTSVDETEEKSSSSAKEYIEEYCTNKVRSIVDSLKETVESGTMNVKCSDEYDAERFEIIRDFSEQYATQAMYDYVDGVKSLVEAGHDFTKPYVEDSDENNIINNRINKMYELCEVVEKITTEKNKTERVDQGDKYLDDLDDYIEQTQNKNTDIGVSVLVSDETVDIEGKYTMSLDLISDLSLNKVNDFIQEYKSIVKIVHVLDDNKTRDSVLEKIRYSIVKDYNIPLDKLDLAYTQASLFKYINKSEENNIDYINLNDILSKIISDILSIQYDYDTYKS